MHSNFKGFQVAHPSPIFHAWDMPYKAYTYTHACNVKFLSSTFCYRGKEKKENTQQIRKQGKFNTRTRLASNQKNRVLSTQVIKFT